MLELLETRIAPATLGFGAQLANAHHGLSLVATDNLGNIIVAGSFEQTIDLDLDPTTVFNITATDATQGDIYIAKYSPQGALLWSRVWGGVGGEDANALAVGPTGDVFLTGGFFGPTANFGGASGGLTNEGIGDVFLLKLKGADGTPDPAFDGDGQLSWGGANAADIARALAVDSQNRAIVGGQFGSSGARFNNTGTGVTATGGVDSFAFRVDAAGAPDLTFNGANGAQVFNIAGFDLISRVRVDAADNVFYLQMKQSGNIDPIVYKRSGIDGSPVTVFNSGGTLQGLPQAPNGSNIAQSADLALDGNGNLVVAVRTLGTSGLGLALSKRSAITGALDPNFNGGADLALTTPALSVALATDPNSNIYLAGQVSILVPDNVRHYVSRLTPEGILDPTFVKGGTSIFGGADKSGENFLFDTGLAIDPAGNLLLRSAYVGLPDLDPLGGVLKLPVRPSVTAVGELFEGFILRLDPFGIDQDNPLQFNDANGDVINVALSGPGNAHYQLAGGVTNQADLDTLELFNTTLATSLTIDSINRAATTTVRQIFTDAAPQDVGRIALADGVTLGGSATAGLVRVTGRLNALTLGDVGPASLIRLGEALPYDLPGAASDTKNNRPSLNVGAILGPGVIFDVTGDGTPGDTGGLGGGGFGNIVIGSWTFPGFLRTTQSIGNFTVQNGDFFGVLEVDKFHHGTLTQANAGNMTIMNGGWGSSGTEIEGDVQSFSAEAFLAGATITAGTLGKSSVPEGEFAGTLILTDPDASSLATFVVGTDFTGNIQTAGRLKKLNIKGNFTGSLSAQFIGSITAFSFIGTTTGDMVGDATKHNINAIEGLGTLTAKSGTVKDYEIDTTEVFKGFNVRLSKLTGDTVGIDHVKIKAARIGNITVSLAALPTATSFSLTGIADSEFVTTATGTAKGATGSIGNISVTINGAAGGASAIGIKNTRFDSLVEAAEFGTNLASTVNALGKITVKVMKQGGATHGLDHVTFMGDTIGATSVMVSPAVGGVSAQALETVAFTARKTVGSITAGGTALLNAQATDLKVWSGGTIGNINISAKTTALGRVEGGFIASGQDFSLAASDVAAALRASAMGALTFSGDARSLTIVSGASIGAITVGGNLKDSQIVAGAVLGADKAIGGSDDVYHQSVKIASLTIKGNIDKGSVSAGINAVNGIFGDGDDLLAPTAGTQPGPSSIGAIRLSQGTLSPTAPALAHTHAIQAGAIAKVIIGTAPPATDFTNPILLDLTGNGEDADDVIVRLR